MMNALFGSKKKQKTQAPQGPPPKPTKDQMKA